VAQPLFDAKKFHMTYFVVVDWKHDWSKYREAYNKGHEIGSHTLNHNTPMKPDEAQPSQDSIKKNIPGEMCISIAYPGCPAPADLSTVKKYYIVGRICTGTANAETPANFYGISSAICGTSGTNTLQGLTSLADQAASSSGWCVYLMHAIDKEPAGTTAASPTSSSLLKDVISYMDVNRDKLWVESMGNVVRYCKERDAAAITQKDSTGTGITLSVTDNLADSIFNYPLSVRRPLPEGWAAATVTQKGKPVEHTMVTVGDKKYIMFKAIPDGGDVVLSQNATAANNRGCRPDATGASLVRLSRNTLIIDSHRLSASMVHAAMFDIRGKLLVRRVFPSVGGADFALPIGNTVWTPLIFKIDGNGKSLSGMLVPEMKIPVIH
jgi:oligosaccharide reducing-end xylanase